MTNTGTGSALGHEAELRDARTTPGTLVRAMEPAGLIAHGGWGRGLR